ncbi:family 20 glycosylhydrolase [Akkermansia muciniphila]|nr:family 20 glycosylhydrolase [Akkermansia muciniphila]
MARPLSILGGILLSFSPPAEATAQYSIIPEPSRTELKQKTAKTLQLLSDQEAPSLGTDAYRLTVTPQGRTLLPEEGRAEFTGWQPSASSGTSWRSSRRASPAASSRTNRAIRGAASWWIPRGILSPSRTWKNSVDLMAYYKFNRLHLHLTDNQGWRLPVPGYPKLKSIASRREESFEDGIPTKGYTPNRN